MSERARTLLSSGWRFIPQSFAVVTQYECLDLMRRGPGYSVYFEDAPYYDPSWQPASGLFDSQAEALLRSIPPFPGATPLDAELRRSVPYDFLRPPRARNTVVFTTAEALTVPAHFVPGGLPVSEAQRRHGFTVITPSNWSKEGLVRCGLPEDKVAVVPHGFDPAVFRPATPARREEIRRRLGLDPEDFVFCHAGVMTTNKGVQFLLPAFAQVCAVKRHARLLLKGTDALYPSREFLQGTLGQLPAEAAEAVLDRIVYVGESLSFEAMAELYQAADCYISPYVAEGFGIPVLEAAACGLPVICTEGGPTADFVSDEFALRIASTRQELAQMDTGGAPPGIGLIPDLEHLVHLMLCMVDDADFRCAAARAAPACVQQLTWSRAVDRLVQVVFR